MMRIACYCALLLSMTFPLVAMAAQPAGEFMSAVSKEFGYPSMAVEQYNGKNADMLQRVMTRFRNSGNASDYQYYVMKSPEWNAFASAGMAEPNVVCLFNGLLEEVQRDDELAGIIAHEISHNRHSDATERLWQAIASGVIAEVIFDDDSGASSGGDSLIFMNFMSLGFSRKMETRSDAEALFMITEMGYDPRSQVALWERIDRRYKGYSGPKILLDHPPSSARARDLQKLIDRHMVQQADGSWKIISTPSFKSNNSNMGERLERGAITGLYAGGVGLVVEAATYEKGKDLLGNSLQWAGAGFAVGFLFDTDFPPTLRMNKQLGVQMVHNPYLGGVEPGMVYNCRF